MKRRLSLAFVLVLCTLLIQMGCSQRTSEQRSKGGTPTVVQQSKPATTFESSQPPITTEETTPSTDRFIGCCLVGDAPITLSTIGTPLIGNLNTPWETELLYDAEELKRLFDVRPHLFYLRESGGPNAFYMPLNFPDLITQEGGNPQNSPDGTIFIGINLLNQEYENTNGRFFSLPSILAHEFAHTVQHRAGFTQQGKWRELHADFLAGYFIGHRERFAKQDVYQAMLTLYSKGDYDYNNPQHHGTPSERNEAFNAGYLLNKRSTSASGAEAYKAGLLYLQEKGASVSLVDM